MAKIEVSKSSEQSSEKSLSRPQDVFSAMRREMERVFEQFERGFPRWPQFFRRTELVVPELDVHENDNAIIVEAELPGVDDKDISVTMANGILTIRGEKKQETEEKNENYYLAERSYGAFERSLPLPDTVDDTKVEAKFENGVLKIKAMKRPASARAERKIEIKKAS